MKKLFAVAFLPVVAGCLSASSPSVALWPIEYRGSDKSETAEKYGVARVSQVLVRMPYNAAGIAVLRANGSIAFDPYNEYAAVPSSLLKGVLVEGLQGSGLFRSVVNASSSVRSSVNVEMFVTKLALDCRKEDERCAVCELLVRIIGAGDEMSVVKGAGREDAADGNYGAAFSKAVTAALESALAKLR